MAELIFGGGVGMPLDSSAAGLGVRPSDRLSGSYTPGVAALRVVDRSSLLTYLNDHLAASVAALKLIERVTASKPDSILATTFVHWLPSLEHEQQNLLRIVAAFDGGGNSVKKAMAWSGEFVSRLKIGGFRKDRGALELFEAIELLSIAFYGRRALWQTLERLANSGVLRLGLDFEKLIDAVQAQLVTLQTFRLDAATFALTSAVEPGRD